MDFACATSPREWTDRCEGDGENAEKKIKKNQTTEEKFTSWNTLTDSVFIDAQWTMCWRLDIAIVRDGNDGNKKIIRIDTSYVRDIFTRTDTAGVREKNERERGREMRGLAQQNNTKFKSTALIWTNGFLLGHYRACSRHCPRHAITLSSRCCICHH